jgi:hypothetical protein
VWVCVTRAQFTWDRDEVKPGWKSKFSDMPFTWDRYENHKPFSLSPLPTIFIFYSDFAFVSMHVLFRSQEHSREVFESCLKCICVYIHPAPNSSRSEDIVGSVRQSGMPWDQSEQFFVPGPCKPHPLYLKFVRSLQPGISIMFRFDWAL